MAAKAEGPYIKRHYTAGEDVSLRCFKCTKGIYMGTHGNNGAYMGTNNTGHYYFCNGGEEHLPFKVDMIGIRNSI